MIALAGRPLLERNVDWLRSNGVSELAINLHHCPDVVTRHFGDGAAFGVSIRYSREPTLLGTAGAVLALSDWLGDETFIVLYADNLISCDVARMLALHRARRAVLTMALFAREDVSSSGVAETDGNGRVLRFIEKPRPRETTSHWVNAGLLVCEPRVLASIASSGAPDFGTDVLPALLGANELVIGYRLGRGETLHWIDTPPDLARAERSLRGAEAAA
jgi:NDP-sugar pyrophosphorylase family protein